LGGLITNSKKGSTTILSIEEEDQIIEWCQIWLYMVMD
jgi:hypothetical protein